MLIFSSSARLFGSIAYEMTGSGNLIGEILNLTPLSASKSLVCVSFSLATAPTSPALISGTLLCVLPWSSTTWPRRSLTSLVTLCSVESALIVPETTRNIVMRPAKGSATVFQTNAALDPLSVLAIVASSTLNGRSAGEGT